MFACLWLQVLKGNFFEAFKDSYYEQALDLR